MSAKDLCTLPFIEKLKKSGVKNFKIEGRNRSPEYVKAVVSIYRKALDKKLSHKEIIYNLNELKKVYNRGFSSGFYIKIPTNDDFSFSENGEQAEHKEFIGTIEKYWSKVKAAKIKIVHGKIKIGDEVYIISKKASIQRVKIESIEINRKKVLSAQKKVMKSQFSSRNVLKEMKYILSRKIPLINFPAI